MSTPGPILESAVLIMLMTPALLFGVLALPSLVRRPLQENVVGTLTRVAMLIAFGAGVLSLFVYFGGGETRRLISYGSWFSAGERGFSFDFLIDGWSLGFAELAVGVSGVVAAFSHRYLHAEHGFNRYFVQFSLFVTGITLVALAGSIEVLFAGWELMGLSSALLVGFFHERRAPVDNALRVFTVYRMSDAAMLCAAVLLHHWAGTGSLTLVFSAGTEGAANLAAGKTTAIALLLILAVAGKSALLPFSGWLPRAMEGPTPSSAVYYGALSIHAGCYLLLRAEPLLRQSIWGAVAAALAGMTTAFYAAIVARVQTDVKSALAYASLAQVGVIVAEIAFGLTTIAFVHILGHACFRLLQFLRAPNLLHELHGLDDDVRHHSAPAPPTATGASRLATSAYLWAIERGLLDALVQRFLAAPLRTLTHGLDRLDRILSGSDPKQHAGTADNDD